MNIFFDVDSTILGIDGTLRPWTRQVFTELRDNGHELFIWSGRGVRTSDIEAVGLTSLVAGIYEKPVVEFTAGLRPLGVPVVPDMVIDDAGGIVAHFGGLCVMPYATWHQDSHDDELLIVPPVVDFYEHQSLADSAGDLDQRIPWGRSWVALRRRAGPDPAVA
jgi:haloacid dehalogenase-like hydrolase